MKSLEIFWACLRGQELLTLVPGWRKKGGRVLLAVALLGLGGGLFALEHSFLVPLLTGLLQVGLAGGRPEVVFSFVFFANLLLVFLSALPLAGSLIFGAKDQNLLQLFPIRPIHPAVGKYLVLLLLVFVAPLLLSVPAFVLYWTKVAFSPVQLIGLIYQLLFMLVLPVAVAIAGQYFLTSFFRLSRFRRVFEFLGLVLIIVAAVALQLTMTRLAQGGMGETATGLVKFFDSLGQAFPPISWSSEPMASAPGWGVLWFGLASGCLVALTLWLLRNYFGRLREAFDVVIVRRRTELSKAGVFLNLLRREWQVLLSQTLFLYEGLGIQIAMPLVLVMVNILPTQVQGPNLMGWLSLSLIFADTQIYLLGGLAVFLGLQHISSTSLSREGRTAALSYLLPIPGRLQALAKGAFHFILTLPQLLIFFGFLIYLGAPVTALVFWLIGGLAYWVVIAALQLSIDLAKPRLDWTNPLQAMKQNPNALWGMGLSILVLLVHVALVWGWFAAGFNHYDLLWALPVFLVGEAAAAVWWVLRRADRAYNRADLSGA